MVATTGDLQRARGVRDNAVRDTTQRERRTSPVGSPSGQWATELPPERLAQIALDSGECVTTASGALVLRTGKLTGRSPRDRFIVRDGLTDDSVAWGSVNLPLSQEHARKLEHTLRRHLAERTTYAVTRHAGGSEGATVRVITTSAAHALFATHLFQAPRIGAGEPITVLHSPDCVADPALHGTASGTFIVLDLASRVILIGGTGYAGEIKKAVFSFLNFELPGRGVLTMHAAANVGARGDTALFFGLSGTGKTTLSADPERLLVGDDEHAWSDQGVFNLEGGCYAKCINLSAQDEPAIWRAVHTPLTLIENVVLDAAREPIWTDASITENTRAAYPLGVLDRVCPKDVVAAPRNVVFLTADAFGLLPPVAKLSDEQIAYYFLCGYTAKVAGTEAGTQTPTPTFSACFGAPFMPRPAMHYARLLRERVAAAGANVWLVNTGWTGGPYGVGQRMPIGETRRIVHAILGSELEQVPLRREPHFGLQVPSAVRGVRPEVLDPRAAYGDPARYDEQAKGLAARFAENYAQYGAGK
ncbi:MAG TPA: phosphoenolpyruvate carboxykinase (ATP) [Polyangiaceae bacterium]|nr:phosphoenolpyruvate carboxykinase (ATP) [Polyangiaceae bacterium]